jgi:hypothetical protein
MKNIIEKYVLSKWWLSILVLASTALMYVFSLSSTNQSLSKITNYALLISAILIMASAIWQFIKGNNFFGILQISLLLLTFLCVFVIASIATMFDANPDVFAENLELPENVELNYPVDLAMDETRPDSFDIKEFTETDFQLYNSLQPGLYQYDLWLKSNIGGTIYLKVFEITKNIRLSKSRLQDASELSVISTNNEVKRFSTSHHFTIYEGDFGQPYGARFEVWLIPQNGREEFKILEKNYVIEGWMR